MGIVQLSDIKFNDERTFGTVAIELNCPLCGFGKEVSLEKIQGVWKVKNISEMWVS